MTNRVISGVIVTVVVATAAHHNHNLGRRDGVGMGQLGDKRENVSALRGAGRSRNEARDVTPIGLGSESRVLHPDVLQNPLPSSGQDRRTHKRVADWTDKLRDDRRIT